METKSASRGGPGRGQGRKPAIAGEVLSPVTIKLSSGQREKLVRLGGAPWVREKIDKAVTPKE